MSSIMEGVPYMYAENLKGKRVNLTIKRVIAGVDFTSTDGRKTTAFDVEFEETPKRLGVPGVTIRRQLCMACGTDDYSQWPGKRVTIFPVASKKSATGWAIRVDTAPAPAKEVKREVAS